MNCAKCDMYLAGEVDMIPCALNLLVNRSILIEKDLALLKSKLKSIESSKNETFKIVDNIVDESTEIEDN
jgi:hypothetical protein